MKYDLHKASFAKRLGAFLIDFIILLLIIVALAPLFSSVFGYADALNQYKGLQKEYEEEYDVKFGLSQAEYNALSDEDKSRYNEVDRLLKEDHRFVDLYSKILKRVILVVFLSILISFIILELIIPLIFKNGQTLGKKFLGLGVMRTDGVRITHLQVFVRSVLGKFTIETMFPLFLLVFVLFGLMGGIGKFIIVALFIMQIAIMIATKTNSLIHDIFAVTVVVDLQKQKIFDSEAELIEFKKRAAEQKAKEQPY